MSCQIMFIRWIFLGGRGGQTAHSIIKAPVFSKKKNNREVNMKI